VLLVATAAGALSYAIVESDAAGWASSRTLFASLTGFLVLGVFVLHQRRTEAPTLDLELFGIGNFRWGMLAMLVFAMAFGAMFFGSLLFWINVWDWSVLKAGLAIAPGPALVALLAPQCGKLAGRIGQRPLVLLGGVFLTISGLYWAVILTSDVGYWVGFVPPFILMSSSIALVFPQATSVAAQALPANRTGVGSAAIQSVRQFGQTFGVAITLAFVGTSMTAGDPYAVFGRIWWTLVVLGVITTACGWPLTTNDTD